jgi:hypothetical protein
VIGVALTLATAAPNDDVVRDYMLCVRRMAARMEPSGDTPTDIADAAKVYCTPARTAALNGAIRGSNATTTEIENAAELYGRAQVVVTRLCRKTKDCGLAHVP